MFHRPVVARQQQIGGAGKFVFAKAPAHFIHPAGSDPAGSDQGVEIGGAPVGFAALVQDDLDHLLVIDALLVDFYRRYPDAFFKHALAVDRDGAGNLAANIGLVAEHGGPGHQSSAAIDRQ